MPRNGAARLLRSSRTAERRAAASLLCTTSANLALLAWVLLLASLIDRAFLDSASLDDLGAPLAMMVALLAVRALLTWAAASLAQGASVALRSELRTKVARSLVLGDPRRLEGDRVGSLSATLTEGVEDVGRWVTDYLPAFTSIVVVPLVVAVAVLVLDPPSTLVLLFAGPMLVMLLAVIGGRTAELTRRRFEELGWLRGFYLDMLGGLGTLKAFGRSRDGSEMISETSRRFGDTTMEVLRTAFQTSLVMEWASTAATALVAVEVSFRLVGGSLTYGTSLAVLLLTPEFFVPFRRLATEYHSGRAGDVAAAAIEEVIAAPEHGSGARGAAQPPPGPPPRVDTEGAPAPPRVTFDGVGYTYPGSSRAALEDFDLVLEAGETVALVGASGVGKSTVASLLLRFIEPGAGSITAYGHELRRYEVANWRSMVAWVPQDPTVFAGTVAQNIALGRPGSAPGLIRAAATDAGADAFISELPDGYDTVLGEKGTTLSGGQRQRLAIARAMLSHRPLVVFDEFTANLDPVTELAVLHASRRLLEGRTALVIAHREQTIAAADRVVALGSREADG